MKVKKIITTAALGALLLATPVFAQTSTTATSSDGMPGTPNTGSVGNAAGNVLLLTGSALVALGGIAALARRRTS